MIIRSLCYFPPVKGSRCESAGRSIREVLNGFHSRLLLISLAAFAMQTLPLLIPFALHRFLPVLMEGPDFSEVRWQELLSLIALTVTVATLRALAAFYFLAEAGRTGHQLVASLRELAFAQLMRLPVRYVEQRGSGRIMLRFIGDTDALRNWFSKTGPKFVADCATAALIIGSLLCLNWKLSLVLVVPLLVTGVVMAAFAGRIRQKTRNARGRQAEFTGFVQTQLSNMRSSKLADARDHTRTEFRSRVAEVSSLNADRDRDAAKLESLAEFSIYFSLPLLVLAGLPLVWSNRLAASELIVFVWLTLNLIALLRSSISAFVIQQKALVSVQRLYVLLSRSAEKGRGAKSVNSEFQTLTLFVDNQRFDFRKGVHQAPEGVDANRLVAVLHGFEPSSEMAVTIDALPIDQIELGQRRRFIGYSPSASEGESFASSTELKELKILIVEGSLSLLGALEQRQIEQLAAHGIVLIAPRRRTFTAELNATAEPRKTVASGTTVNESNGSLPPAGSITPCG